MNRKAIPILLYHGISECREDGIFDPFYAMPAALLRAQINWLRSNGYLTVPLDSLLSASPPPEYSFIITVDDGLRSMYTHIFPVLKDAGYQAIIFPVTARIGKSGWVNWRELDEMHRGGMELGSHSVTHANLAGLSRKQLKSELEDSKKLLEDRLGVRVRYLSLPGGYGSSLVRLLAQEVGYEAICSSVFGYNRFPLQRYQLRRFCLRRNDDEATVRSIMRRDSLALLPRRIVEKGKGFSSLLLGRRLYSRLRSRFLPDEACKTLPRFPD